MTMQDNDVRLGQVCYEAYATQAGGRSLISGDDLPPWDELSNQLKVCWVTAAMTVAAQIQADQRGT